MENIEKFAKDAIEIGNLIAEGLSATDPDDKCKIAKKISKRSFEITKENLLLAREVA